MKFFIMLFSPVSCYFLHLGSNIFPSTLLLYTLSLHSSLNVTYIHTHIKKQENYSSVYCILCALQQQMERQKIQDQTAAGLS